MSRSPRVAQCQLNLICECNYSIWELNQHKSQSNQEQLWHRLT